MKNIYMKPLFTLCFLEFTYQATYSIPVYVISYASFVGLILTLDS
jgi:hypothetical protein